MSDISLSKAIEVCESFGFRVIDKERIKNLSYHVAITKSPFGMSNLTEEDILSIHERKIKTSIENQIYENNAIKHSIDDQEMVKYHHWNLRVIV